MLGIAILIGMALGAVAVAAWQTVGRLPTSRVVTISLRPEKGDIDGESAQGVLVSWWGPWVRLERAVWLRPHHDPVPVQGVLWVPRARVLCVQLDPELQGVAS